MVVVLGYDLDGPVRSPLPAAGAEAGVVYAGPLRLVQLLEQIYGLPDAMAPPLARRLAYQQALTALDDGAQFYSRSFALDPLGVAAVLLAARDELLLAARSGFSYGSLTVLGGRPAVMARIEHEAQAQGMPPGPGDRMRAIIDELAAARVPPAVSEVRLAEPRASWPPLMSELLYVLEFSGTTVGAFQPLYPRRRQRRHGHDLTAVAQALGGTTALDQAASAPFAGDGSVSMVRAGSLIEAGDAAAALIRAWSRAGDDESVCVIAEAQGELLDAALARGGLPAGGHQRTVWGGDASQLLPAVLQLLWRPVDPRAMQRYLLLDPAPLPRRLRRVLLDELDRMPGVWGQAWRQRLAEANGDGQAAGTGKAAEQVARWLPEPIADDGEAIAASQLLRHAEQVAAWTRRTGHVRPLPEAAARLADAAAAALRAQGPAAFTRLSTERLLADVAAAIPLQRRSERAAGGPFTVTAAGAMLAPADRVLWWQAAESTVPKARPAFYTTAERDALEQLGVRLQARLLEIERSTEQWRRVARLTRRQLVLVYAEQHGDEVDGPHPMWFMLQLPFAARTGAAARTAGADADADADAGACADSGAVALAGAGAGADSGAVAGAGADSGTVAGAGAAAVLAATPQRVPAPATSADRACALTASPDGRLDAAQLRAAVAAATGHQRSGGQHTRTQRPLQPPARAQPPPFSPVWSIAPIVPRDRESATSLETLLGCPLRYVLDRHAGLRPRHQWGLFEGNRLLGLVAHAVISDVLGACTAGWPDEDALESMLRQRLTVAFHELATLLLVPGMDRERAEVETLSLRAARTLTAMLAAGGYRVVGVEREYAGDDAAVPQLIGRVDLVVEREDPPQIAVIDLKWSGRGYHRQLLTEQRAVQLAHYAKVVAKATAPPLRPVATGYFIITSAELFTAHADLMPGALLVEAPDEQRLWDALWPVAERRRAELAAGTVLVGTPAEHWQPGAVDTPLPAPCRFCDYELFCRVSSAEPGR